MDDNHTRPIMTWRPPASLDKFIRSEAKRKGLRLSEYLTILVEREREARERN